MIPAIGPILAIIALILTLGTAVGKLPLWPAVFVICIALIAMAI